MLWTGDRLRRGFVYALIFVVGLLLVCLVYFLTYRYIRRRFDNMRMDLGAMTRGAVDSPEAGLSRA